MINNINNSKFKISYDCNSQMDHLINQNKIKDFSLIKWKNIFI